MNKKNCLKFGMAFLLLAPGMLLASCGEKHDYSQEWSHDETSHWHACQTEGHTDTSDAAEHTFGEWTEKTPAGVHTDKVESRSCTVCGYETERTVENTGYHSYSNDWKYDANNHWRECTVEGCDAKKDSAAHTLKTVKEVPATCVATGVAEHKVCDDCGAVIDLNGDLVTDLSALTISIDAAKHNFSEWIEEVAAVCGTETNGTKGHYDCLDCHKHFDASKNEMDDLTIAWSHDLYKCYAGSVYHRLRCKVCEKYIDGTDEKHTEVLKHNDTQHWYECDECNSILDRAEHTYGDPETVTEAGYGTAGSQKQTCTVCGYEKITALPALSAKDRTIAYNGPTSKTYDGKMIDIKTSNIAVTTTSTETAETDIKSGYGCAFYCDAECKTPFTAGVAPKDVGTYYCMIVYADTAEWKRATKIVEYTINPIVVTTFTKETAYFDASNVSEDGILTLAECTSVEGQTVKATVELTDYKTKGQNIYSFSYDKIQLTDGDGSTDTSYLKNYTVMDGTPTGSGVKSVYIYNESTETFSIKSVESNTKDTSTGKQISTIEVKINIESGKSVFLTVGDKYTMGTAYYFTVTGYDIGGSVYTETGETHLVYSSYSNTIVTFTAVGGFTDSFLLDKTLTKHVHTYGINGACACGDSIAHTFEYEEKNVDTQLPVVDDKAYFNFEYCEGSSFTYFYVKVVEDLASIDCYRGSDKVCSLNKTGRLIELDNERFYYVWKLPTDVTMQGNEQYCFVMNFNTDSGIEETSMRLAAPFHEYGDDNECDNPECGWVKE